MPYVTCDGCVVGPLAEHQCQGDEAEIHGRPSLDPCGCPCRQPVVGVIVSAMIRGSPEELEFHMQWLFRQWGHPN